MSKSTYYFPINYKILSKYFNKKVRECCKDCKRFNHSSSCPPLIESVEYYQELLKNCNKGWLVIKYFEIINLNLWKELGIQSSEELRQKLNYLKDNNKLKDCFMLGAGSCKHCLKCSFPCKVPEQRLIPLEGIGINVVKLVYDLSEGQIKIQFPVEIRGFFYRVGALLYVEK